MKILSIILLIAAGIFNLSAESVVVQPQDAVIFLPKSADKIKQFAAIELARHLKLITGKDIQIINSNKVTDAGKYLFIIGKLPKNMQHKFAPEEAVFVVDKHRSWFAGDDLVKKSKTAKLAAVHKRARTGTLFAVYLFLEKELGVKWIKPGDDGTVFTPHKALTLKIGKMNWIPKLTMRIVRPGYGSKTVKGSKNSPQEFQLSAAERRAKKLATQVWLKRMRMGRSKVFSYGHAFTKWWKLYGKTHPEYFALTTKGKREPFKSYKPDRVKLCVSNPAVRQLVVDNFMKTRGNKMVINTCENDSGNFCECAKCRALDATAKKTNSKLDLTDRYIFFTNSILALARKQLPNVETVMYAYSVYRYPPQKIKVADGVILGFVPHLLDNDLDAYYKSWVDAGAKKFFLRPNDMHIDPGLPMGFEKKMFDNFQIAYKYGIFGTDYDSIHNFWPVSGIANYILARAIADPEKSFEHWEDEYCSTYGAAAPAVKAYYRYWRKNIFAKKLTPDRDIIEKKGRYGNFRRGLMWNLYNYYSKADFDKTDAILKAGLKLKLTVPERQRLERLSLNNQHARLMFEAMRAKYQKPQNVDKLIDAATRLAEFRQKNRQILDFDWEFLLGNEAYFGDVCGLKMVKLLAGLHLVKKLSTKCFFKVDPKNIGLKANWQQNRWSKIKRNWDTFRVGENWEKVKCKPELHQLLKNYDGIGWYALQVKISKNLTGKQLFLTFGAVDESCWVYINGQLAGQHLFKNENDWKTPFSIRIDQQIDWKKGKNTIIVRVEDKSGSGGIWQPIYLTVKK